MMSPKEIVKYSLEALNKAGAQKSQVNLTFTEKREVNLEANEFTMLRTTFDTDIVLTAIKDNKKGTISINKSDRQSIDSAANDVILVAEASPEDEANDISEYQLPKEFSSGDRSPDLEMMYHRIKELLKQIKEKYPKIILIEAFLYHEYKESYFANSNGVDYVSNQGVYNFFAMFSSKDQEKTSSFNYTSFSLKNLDKELLSCGTLDILLKQLEEQTTTRPVEGKFVGDVIISPDAVNDILDFLTRSLSDNSIISGTSIYKDKLEKQIASPLLTVHSCPVSEEICSGYFVTKDGYEARNITIIDKGVLKNFLLSLYGSKKTGLKYAYNDGGAFVIEPGETALDDMIRSVKKGILLMRFSGGYPSDSGDFSGVAKNSYLIEDGKIKYPISETMISGNIAEMLINITAISKEQVNFGWQVLPWISVKGVTISGK
ncbi:TldD/PmbA family protein [Caldanaerobacter subterraneus KAk]|uniref:Zn-dependent protease n=1 Tax=Caldanaerobacter subterraneus subsp. pacificus DSM 12653 TaxID=391606 RepID=B7R7R4_9THEO|nr:TldD/PmbA family protein [Caldanaerobacter subterraneus]KKC28540.1 Zn-dependent protease [Caldanaerobacter subterraneus subsp. pacificus DSM 12653]